ncbi:uncharacterized protein LOC143891659 [Tasmannia lanceolata]|uniref:uncharacterized protein LOC143891659 n=1 Tax=Tasmannia lanceolata TaxID=3420 RepID=UPI0040628D19
MLRHPADSSAWRTLDCKYPEFSSDPRNVRLGLASDGFNPFRTMSIAHSTWPVVLFPYNLPQWMCMKQPYMILSLLIPGSSAPGNDIDVYLQPLIEELKELWDDGLQTYDASRNETFRMHAALLWTISDFPAYANLSGWSTKGKLACPSCNKDTCSRRLKFGWKQCYMGHRRFLPSNHSFRLEKWSFDGIVEDRSTPKPLTGCQVLDQLQDINVTLGKKKDNNVEKPDISKKKLNTRGKKRGREENPKECEENLEGCEENPSNNANSTVNKKTPKEHNWKKKSIFFSLPYWESLLLRHNLDVMHIEKNVCDSVIGTLLNIEACFTMSSKEKEVFCNILKEVKVPDGYSSNISRRVHIKERKISGLKSHDCHVLMQQLLPLTIRSSLPKNVSSVLIELCNFFRELCAKVINANDLKNLKDRITLTLCHMEKIFPPAFFDIMVHLPIHLADEARIAGPVQYRWMYPVERFLFTLKSYVRNRNYVEGSIADGYLAKECLTFCSRYLEGVESKLNRPLRNDEDVQCEIEEGFSMFSTTGRPLGEGKTRPLDRATIEQAHRYVLFNCHAVAPEHFKHIQNLHPRARPMDIEQNHNKKFSDWFRTHIHELHQSRSEQLSEKVRWLAGGPSTIVTKYMGYLIKGFRFHTKKREQRRKTQNSGVIVTATTRSFSTASDQSPIAGDVNYYGVLTDIVEVDYYGHLKALMFKCDWFDVFSPDRGLKIDDFGFTIVNMSRHIYKDEPFIFASQAEQVFYVQERPINKDWHVVIKMKPRDLYDVHGENEEELVQAEVAGLQNLEDIDSCEHTDIDGTEIDESLETLTQAIHEDKESDTESDDEDEDDNDLVDIDTSDTD